MRWILFVVLLSGCQLQQHCDLKQYVNTVECKTYRAFTQCGPSVAALAMREEPDIVAGNYTKVLADAASQLGDAYPCFADALRDRVVAQHGRSSADFIRFLTADGVQRVHIKLGH